MVPTALWQHAKGQTLAAPKHEPIRGPMPYTNEWYALRYFSPGRKLVIERPGLEPLRITCPVVFGATDAAALCGVSEWKTPLHVYHDKRQEMDKQEETDAMRLGKALEPVVIGEYVHRTGIRVRYPQPMFLHPVHHFLAATPDAMGNGDDDDSTKYPIDAKTTNWVMARRAWGDEGTDQVPVDILMQAQMQMLVTGTEIQHTVVLIDGRNLKIYEIERNQELCDSISVAAHEMASRIIDGNPPEPNWEHSQTPALIKNLYGVSSATTVGLPAEVMDWQAQIDSIASAVKRMEDQSKVLKAKIMAAMGEAAVGRCIGWGYEITRQTISVPARTQAAYSFIRLGKRRIKE